jgi:arginyl-tRNA--protein-N-Asp/Glu arginylyltransferase
MKLLFSEAKSDYANYIFPYSIWAFPDPGEHPSQIFDRGFLPSSNALDRFYLCRHIRVSLKEFAPSSENRRILRKGEGIECKLVARADFQITPERLAFCKKYADGRFGSEIMSRERLEALFASRVATHILSFTDKATGAEVGLAVLYLEQPNAGFYYYAFYDLAYFSRNLGMFMMTTAVETLARSGLEFLYLGTCYSENAMYKFQFLGAEFFNGFAWSRNAKELRYLVNREQSNISRHLLETLTYREDFWTADLQRLAERSLFSVS